MVSLNFLVKASNFEAGLLLLLLGWLLLLLLLVMKPKSRMELLLAVAWGAAGFVRCSSSTCSHISDAGWPGCKPLTTVDTNSILDHRPAKFRK
jgi:CHASE2 domain-containing sensor protein